MSWRNGACAASASASASAAWLWLRNHSLVSSLFLLFHIPYSVIHKFPYLLLLFKKYIPPETPSSPFIFHMCLSVETWLRKRHTKASFSPNLVPDHIHKYLAREQWNYVCSDFYSVYLIYLFFFFFFSFNFQMVLLQHCLNKIKNHQWHEGCMIINTTLESISKEYDMGVT